EIAGLSREVREHDPLAALDGGPDGLDFYKALAQGVGAYLYKDGMVAVEIGAGQFQDVEALFKSTGFSLAGEANDLGGHRRAMLFGQISNTQF
ncbi:protein-(glutamine-N5) methyltransferase, release factor-specific, partial [Brucella melitensis]